MMKIFFTSDTHYEHARILELCPNRPYKSVDEMNAALVDNHNLTVAKNDLVFFLGDFVMGLKSVNLPKITSQLNGIKVLVLGNHDAKFKHTQMYLDAGFFTVYEHSVYLSDFFLQHEIDDPIVDATPQLLLCHYPAIVDSGHHLHEDNYVNRRPDLNKLRENTFILHGHTHSLKSVTGSNQIHVGVDSWGMKPVNLDQIIDLRSQILQEDLFKSCLLCDGDIPHSNCTFD